MNLSNAPFCRGFSSALLVALGCLTARAEAPPGDAPPQEARHGVLVLRNQRVLSGEIQRIEDQGSWYQVRTAHGRLSVRASDVELACRDLDEAYRLRRVAAEKGGAGEHLRLAEWCLRLKLYGYAAREIIDARAADPSLPGLDAVQRRLWLAIDRPAERTAAKSVRRSVPSSDDLQRAVDGLPPEALPRFTNTVQPLLVNSCSASRCHGKVASSPFRLERTTKPGRYSQRLTLRNLHAVLAAVDLQDPDASPLLTRPAGPHGPLKAAVFSDRDARQYQQLVDWVYQVAGREAPLHESFAVPAAASVEDVPSEFHPIASGFDPPHSGRPAGGSGTTAPRPASRVASEVGRRDENDARLPADEPLRLDPSLDRRDPFDPEVFNRRYGDGNRGDAGSANDASSG